MDFNHFKHPDYNSIYISNPPLAFALKWFRDVKHDHSFVCCDLNNVWTYYLHGSEFDEDFEACATYEAVESALLNKLLKLIL
jgi:hypothetical protein